MPAGGLLPAPVLDFHARLAPTPGAADRLLAVMDACGVTRALVAPGGVIGLDALARQLAEGGHVEHDPDNDAVLEACARARGRLLPCYFANPHRPVSRYAEVARSFRCLEISPAVHGVPLTDPRVEALVDVAGEVGHAVYTVCLPRPGAGVRDLVRLAARSPQVTFVLGHLGVSLIDTYAVELVAPWPNVLVDTSGGYTAVLRRALDRLGAGRLLFAAEHPLQDHRVELAKVAALGLPPAVEREVTWLNALRLLDEEDE